MSMKKDLKQIDVSKPHLFQQHTLKSIFKFERNCHKCQGIEIYKILSMPEILRYFVEIQMKLMSSFFLFFPSKYFFI